MLFLRFLIFGNINAFTAHSISVSLEYRSPSEKKQKKTAPENLFLISLLSDELEIFNIAQVEVQEVDNLMLDDNH